MVEGMGSRLADLRTGRRLSQKEVAAALGLSQSAVSQYEVGEAVPKLETVIKLASFYRCSLDYLLTGKSDMERMKILDVSMLTDEQYALIREFVESFRKEG